MIVGPNERYSAATAETVGRIEARDHVLEIFVTLSAALIAFSLGGREFYGVIIGFAALATALLSRHHDVIIGLLGEFQCRLAKFGDSAIPNWFDDTNFIRVLRERFYRDCSVFMFLFTGGLMGLYVAWPSLPHDPVSRAINLRSGEPHILIWELSSLFWFASLLVVISTGYTRWDLVRSRLENKLNFRSVFAVPFAVLLTALAILIAIALQVLTH